MKQIKAFLPFVFFAAVVLILFYNVIFFGHVFYDGFDNFNYLSAPKHFFATQVSQGIFPLWNPYLFIGIPYFADIALGTLSIFTLLYFVFPAFQATTLISVICVFLISCFQYIFLRHLKLSKTSCIFGALTFTYAGTIFTTIGAVDVISVIVYIPILFLLVSLFYKKKKMLYLFLLTLLQCLQILSGHPRIVYYTILFISLSLAFWSNFPWKKKVFILFFYWLFSILLASVQIVPFIEYVLMSNRPLSSLSFASSSSLTLTHFITTIFPTFFGSHKDGTWWGPQTMLYGYIGVPGLIFLFVGILKAKILKKSYYIIGLFLSLCLAFGKVSPIYLLFYYVVPGWKSFRAPIDIMIFFTFFASILAGCGLDYVLRHPFRNWKFLTRYIHFFLIPIGIFFSLFVYISFHVSFWKNMLSHIYTETHLHSMQRLLIYDSTKLQIMFQGIFGNFLLLFLSLLLVSYIFVFLSRNKRTFGICIIALTTLLFIYFDSQAVETAPVQIMTNAPLPSFLSKEQENDYRILSLPIDLHQQREHLAIPDFFYKEALVKLTIYQGNVNVLSTTSQVNANSPLIPNSYMQFMGASNLIPDVSTILFKNITKDQLDESSIRYIFSHDPIATFSTQLVLRYQDRNRYVYENMSARKRAYLLTDSLSSKVDIIDMKSNAVKIHVQTDKPAKLIVSNWYYPGWNVYVNGSQTMIQKYKNVFQEVSVPKGGSSVIFTYNPLSFRVGLVLSSVAAILFGILYWLYRKVKIY